MNLKHFFTTTCLAMCVSFSAQAVIIDHGDFLSDTDSGLDWLDVTKSRNMSINSVNAQLGTGGTFEGWRYATGNEFNALITHFTGITINTFDRTPIPVDDAFNLVVMLGQTGLFFNSRQAENVTLGILSDKNSVGGFWTAQINWTEQNAFPTNIFTGSVWAHAGTVNDGNIGSPNLGSFLVRATATDTGPVNSVPEPSLIGLLAIGLLGMGIFGRKTARETNSPT